MDTRTSRIGLFVALLQLAGCAPTPPVEQLPSADASLLQVRRRVGESFSLKELAAFINQGERVLEELKPGERHALGRNLIRLKLDQSARVTIAAPVGHEPFWLHDQAFNPTNQSIKVDGVGYSLHERAFPAGWIGLGINAFDLRTPAHYLIFLHDEHGNPVKPSKIVTDIAYDKNPLIPLPIDLSRATLIAPARSERHRTVFLESRPWKTHVPSRPTPDQIVVSYGANAATSLAWNWRTRPEVIGSRVRLVEASRKNASSPRSIDGSSITVESFGLLNDPVIRRHSARAENLNPNTLYAYSVGDGSAEGWSSWQTVTTGPAPDQPTRLMYLGDAQCGLENWGVLLHDAVRRHPDVRAILLAGDLVDRGNERSNWDHFFMRAQGVFERFPFLPAVGNHEYLDRGPIHYSASFTLPVNGPKNIESGLVYTTEIGDALILVLDSNLAKYDPSLAKIQADWLESQARKSRATWRLAMFHHPVYASHPTRENPEIAAAWIAAFERAGIDLVLQGHDHAYLRTHPMRAGQVASEEEGITYVVAVSGDKFVDQEPRPYTEVGFINTPTYQLIDIDPKQKTLLYRALDAHGKERDRLQLTKRGVAKTRLANPVNRDRVTR